MAYVVGSVSVEVVPDFRNAQNKITAWFKSQPDALKVPVRPDLDQNTVQKVEREAKQLGDNVGKAMSEGQRVARQKALQREIADEVRAQQKIADEKRRVEDRARAETLRQEKQYIDNLVKTYHQAIDRVEKDRIQVKIDEQHALRAGRQQGGLVVRAMEEEIHQNAGLIAAAVGGALLLGAPVVSAAAIGLFQGLGAAAAAQSQEVRTAWIGTWDEIKNAAVEDGRIIAPAYERLAVSVANSIQRMRPIIQDGFAAGEAQVDVFGEALTKTAETVVPAFVRSVQTGMPVVIGFGNLLDSTGDGLAEFLDILSNKAPASGRALQLLGGTMEELLPLIGTLAADGVELATGVLPLLNTGLKAVNFAADTLGTSLSSIGAGFLIFRGAQGAGRMLANFGATLGNLSEGAGRFEGRVLGAGRALSALGRSMPYIGAAAAVVGFQLEEASVKQNDWTARIIEGGAAARGLREEYNAQRGAGPDWLQDIDEITGFDASLEDATQAAKDQLAAMDPLTRSHVLLQQAANNLAFAMEDEEAAGMTVAEAQAEVARRTAEAEAAQSAMEMATRGVTEAMAEQADALLASVDAQFAYQDGLFKIEDAQTAYNDAVDEFGKKSDEADRAMLKLNQSLADSVKNASKMATQGLPVTMDDAQTKILGAKAALDEMNRLIEAGFDLPPELETLRLQYENLVNGADGAALAQAQLQAAFEQLGYAVEAIPGTKAIRITDEESTPVLLQKLQDLGFTVERLPGEKSVRVYAESEEAKANLDNLAALLAELGIEVATPVVELEDGPFKGVYDGVMGLVRFLDVQNPTPTADLNSGPYRGVHNAVMSLIGGLGRQRPTPTADMNDNPFAAVFGGVMGNLHEVGSQRPTPSVFLNDYASNGIAAIQNALANLRDRTINVTTVYATRGNATLGQASGRPTAAIGGSFEDILGRAGVQKMATGGQPMGWGAVYGAGGPVDDRVPILASPGEHMFDARDVALMGGQQAVYAFREALNRGIIGSRARDTSVRNVIAAVGGGDSRPNHSVAGFVNNGTVVVRDEREMMRQAEQRRREALVAIGV